MRNYVQLITYADRLGGNLSGLRSLLDNEFCDLFGGVHVLPFFDPIDGTDAGFDPVDHTKVDPRLGSWGDVASLSAKYSFMADLIVNHVSAESRQFQDVMHRGENSEYWELFLKRNDVFPDESSLQDIDKVYRPRPGSPFTTITLEDGTSHEFWTTFSSQQLDINVECESGSTYLKSILEKFAESGVQGIRLDAAGYAIKRRGTTCFMLPETFDFIESLRKAAAEHNMDVLVEIHSHYQTQIDIAAHVPWVYDFALPPLVLHTFFTADSSALKRWFSVSPRNCITVLDTHDGIGIVDAAGDGERAGLLNDAQIEELLAQIDSRTEGQSSLASGQAASNLDIYQVNTTFHGALGRSDKLYLLARAVQFFAPGVPQIYYMGLLAGENDTQLLEKTGVGRDINRHYYTNEEIHAAMRKPVVQSLLAMIRLRNSARGFQGDFDMPDCTNEQLHMRWRIADDSIELFIDLKKASGIITQCESGIVRKYTISDTFNEVAENNIIA